MKRQWLVLALVGALLASAHGMWIRPDPVPLDRLIANAMRAVEEDPNQPHPHYLLGRLHSLAFALKADTVYVYEPRAENPDWPTKPFDFPSYESMQVHREARNAQLNPNELRHLNTSLREYRNAVFLAPNNALYRLGFAWMHEEAAPYASQIDPIDGFRPAKMTAAALRNQAAYHYRLVYRQRKPIEMAEESSFRHESARPGYESAVALLRLFRMGVRPRPSEIADLQRTIKALDAKGHIVTPIVFPVPGARGPLWTSLPAAQFDLDGLGFKRSWPWVTPAAAFLAWDPESTGMIRSGVQLFGSRTFQMQFKDGYDALASLDDDGNGWLEKGELAGIVVWHDRNANAVSDPGEVTTLGPWGIEAIATMASGRHQGMPMAQYGLRTVLGWTPTIDWMPRAAPLAQTDVKASAPPICAGG